MCVKMVDNWKYVYIDTKIIGAIRQLIEYFQSGVLSKDNTFVYIKIYKGYFKEFSKILTAHGIHFKGFIKYSEIKMKAGSVVFYLFNAQSNCRMVANRELVHVFVTHGESNKVSSIKPIIRIYDYIVCAGLMGINRYLKHQIFYEDDVSRNRLIMMGNTFIGQNNYLFDNKGSILYAPTWEGGIPDENYCSMGSMDVFVKLLRYLSKHSTSTLIVQPHPNLGHRDSSYSELLIQGIKFLNRNNIKVVLVSGSPYSFLKKGVTRLLSKGMLVLKGKEENFYIKEAFCDISAMEVQLYNKCIPTRVLWPAALDVNKIEDDLLVEHYATTAILEYQDIKDDSYFDRDFVKYALGYTVDSVESMPLSQRADWLVNYVVKMHFNSH